MTTELLPCPFCGSADLDGPHFTEYVGDHRSPSWWIECNKCPCGMEHGGEESSRIVAAWNRRAQSSHTKDEQG